MQLRVGAEFAYQPASFFRQVDIRDKCGEVLFDVAEVRPAHYSGMGLLSTHHASRMSRFVVEDFIGVVSRLAACSSCPARFDTFRLDSGRYPFAPAYRPLRLLLFNVLGLRVPPPWRAVGQDQTYAKSSSWIETHACAISSLARDLLRNSRDSAGSSVLVMMLSIIRPPVSGSLHLETI